MGSSCIADVQCGVERGGMCEELCLWFLS
jgi:hypothetical protein